ncbi:GntR family transcriptional regulator [Pseudovibrio denitrificans]|uniref:GntR family transcriptional regulator n=1 Tax=Pseudovibrio denitrificans TaxID=258256 RepID=UPI000A42A4BB|nr:GntR family transcriptional regulator [Pseudovibrio denitrificans]
MTLDPNRRRYQDVAEELVRDLANGAFAIGDKLPTERKISEDLGVSRSLVRDAMIMLEVQGLVDVRKGSGTYVLRLPGDVTPDSALETDIGPFELLQARQLLESNIAAFAATMATKATSSRCVKHWPKNGMKSSPVQEAIRRMKSSTVWLLRRARTRS